MLQTNAPSLQPLLKCSIANSFQCSWFMVGKPHNHYQKYNFQLFSAQMIIQCHYSNTEELIKLLKEIVVPFVEKIRAKLDDPNQSALLIWGNVLTLQTAHRNFLILFQIVSHPNINFLISKQKLIQKYWSNRLVLPFLDMFCLLHKQTKLYSQINR